MVRPYPLALDAILRLPAGQELDALVAEKVVGLIPGKDWHSPCFDVMFCDRPCPPYSTSIAAAWAVVDKVWKTLPLCTHGTYRFMLNRREPYGEYVCEFAPDADGDWTTHATGQADTAPLAICRAALKAVMG